MSSGNDTPMSRFLFAILKQVNLRNVNWNDVASDPVLAQEITNGHAARMRYSRFRTQLEGTDSHRRTTRVRNEKSKVVKQKRNPRTKSDLRPKSGFGVGTNDMHDPNLVHGARIKQEASKHAQSSEMTRPTSSGTVSLASHCVQRPEARLLTPCSDADVFATLDGRYAPGSADGTFLAQPSSLEFQDATGGDTDGHPAWPDCNSYTTFNMPYNIEPYMLDRGSLSHGQEGMQAASDSPVSEFLHYPDTAGENESLQADMVKNEPWDMTFP